MMVGFHAEPSEKQAIGLVPEWRGRANAVLGSHTHEDMAYPTDVGMAGP